MNIRDSLTGRYISAEEANKLTPERYEVEEVDSDESNLEAVWNELEARFVNLPEALYIPVEEVKQVFVKHGLKV